MFSRVDELRGIHALANGGSRGEAVLPGNVRKGLYLGIGELIEEATERFARGHEPSIAVFPPGSARPPYRRRWKPLRGQVEARRELRPAGVQVPAVQNAPGRTAELETGAGVA